MKQADAVESQKREQAHSATRCLRKVLEKTGQFDGRNVTRYMKAYWQEATIEQLSEEVAIRQFSTLVEPELKGIVDAVVEKASRDKTWRSFEKSMKEEFQLEDADRITQVIFCDWIHERNKKLGPQELLREFNKKYNQLPDSEAQVVQMQRCTLFLRAADEKLRDELENALDLIDPNRTDSSTSWDNIEKAVMKVSHRHRRRDLDQEAINGVSNPAKVFITTKMENTTSGGEKKEVKIATPESKGGVEELADLMKNLTILTTQVLNQTQGAKATPTTRTWNCMWCDSKDHRRNDCAELSAALKNRLVKYVGEVGQKKLAFYNTEELIPLNNNRGGMRVLVERKLSKEGASAATTIEEPNVFAAACVSEKMLDDVGKKRLANYIRQQTGWDAPVWIAPITAEVGATWEARVEDKRKTPSSDAPRGKMPRREASETPESSTAEDGKKEKPMKKGPGWILGRDVEQAIEPESIADKFWKQEARGFTNEEFFGSLRRDIQEAILTRAKKKRFYKEGPYALAGEVEDSDNEGEMESSVCTLQVGEKKDGKTTLESIEVGAYHAKSVKEMESYWARACNEVEVELIGIKGPIKALIDSGSEVNLMSKELYNQGRWKVDRDIQWKVKSVNASKNSLWGACPDVKLKVGNVVEDINVFVHESLPYSLLLGQPFITEWRLETKVLDDGTHMAKVKSKDNLRVIQFPTVHPEHVRNRRELRTSEELEGETF
jgi:hypothetical protein